MIWRIKKMAIKTKTLEGNIIEFIPAMGATHVDEGKLLAIANRIRDTKHNHTRDLWQVEEDTVRKYIHDTYGILVPQSIRIWCHVEWMAEEKYDGYSYLGIDGRMISRSLSTAKDTKGYAVDKSNHIPQIANFVLYLSQKYGMDVHGEVYKPGGTSDDVTKILGCGVDKAHERQMETGMLYYIIHDIRKFHGRPIMHEPYYIRRAILETIHETDSRWLDTLYTKISDARYDSYDFFNEVIGRGGEGLMLKYTNCQYVPDKKPANNWVKWKKEITLDCVIMGFNNDGSGKNKDLFKSMQVGLWEDGKVKFIGDIHSGITDELRLEMHNNRGLFIGKVVEIDAMELSKNGSLRHGRLVRFRDDKNMEQCTKDGLRVRTW